MNKNTAHLSSTNPTFLIITLGLLTAFGPLSIDMYLPAFDVMAKALDTSLPHIQTTLSVFFIGMAFGQLIYGPLSDRIGRKPPLYWGLGIYVLASIICAFAPEINTLIAARLLQALGGCAGVVMARAVARDCFPPQEMARVMSLLMLVMGLAPVLAPLAGGLMVEALPLEWGWRAIFGVFALLGTLSLGMVAMGLPETLPSEQRLQKQAMSNTLKGYVALLKNPSFALPALSGSMGLACLFAYITGSSVLFLDYLKLSPVAYSAVFATNAIGIIGGAQINRRLLKNWSMSEVLSGAYIALLLGGLLFSLAVSFSHSAVLIACALWLPLAALGFIMPNSTALALADQKKQAGAASAVLGMMQYLLGSLGAAGVTWGLAQYGGHPLALAMVLMIFAVLGLIFDKMTQMKAHPLKEAHKE